MVLITKTHIYCANAGDSRGVLSQKKIALDLSIDHKPDLPSERSRVLKAGHIVDDGRVDGIIAISRAIGDWEYKDPKKDAAKMAVSSYPEVKIVEIKADTEFIICACDGIWDCMTSQEAVNFVYKAKDKQATFEASSPKTPSSGSPTKTGKSGRLGKSPTKKLKMTADRKLESAMNNSKFTGLATVVEMMMDINCPADLQVSEGLGADNMTCIIIEFNK